MDRSKIARAMQPSVWEVTNDVLYKLCRSMPAHTDRGQILAKINLIGRAYAAAIERRQVREGEPTNEGFYEHVVAPFVERSEIDEWLKVARSVKPGTGLALQVMVEVHGEVTSLFKDISGHEKRSLASKYLHSHVPRLFFIYDSRAAKALREYADVLPRATKAAGVGDNQYRKFAEKCTFLVQLVSTRYGLNMTPRQLDNLLLGVNER